MQNRDEEHCEEGQIVTETYSSKKANKEASSQLFPEKAKQKKKRTATDIWILNPRKRVNEAFHAYDLSLNKKK